MNPKPRVAPPGGSWRISPSTSECCRRSSQDNGEACGQAALSAVLGGPLPREQAHGLQAHTAHPGDVLLPGARQGRHADQCTPARARAVPPGLGISPAARLLCRECWKVKQVADIPHLLRRRSFDANEEAEEARRPSARRAAPSCGTKPSGGRWTSCTTSSSTGEVPHTRGHRHVLARVRRSSQPSGHSLAGTGRLRDEPLNLADPSA